MRRHPGYTACSAIAGLIACSASPTTLVAPSQDGAARVPAAEIISCVDLPRADPQSHNLSGLAWDGAAGLLYAVSDRDKQLTVLRPRPDFAGYDFQSPIALAIDVPAWDGEALAIAGDRFLVVAEETRQAVFSVDRTGRDASPVALPEFAGARDNLGLEGLGYAVSSAGRYVFTVNEAALVGDGPTSTTAHGTVVRILRHPLDGGDDLEVAYLTDPVFGDGARAENGVSDLVAVSSDRVLLLERAYVKGAGNAIRVYAVDFRAAPNIIALADARAAAPIAKRLIVDLAVVPDDRCSTPPQPQRRRSLENYEGLTLGPTLGDGRPLLLMVSDDNFRPGSNQVARVLAVALAPGALAPYGMPSPSLR
jgi:hypothetical protein